MRASYRWTSLWFGIVGKLYTADAANSYWLGTVPGRFSVTGYVTLHEPLENRTGKVTLGFTNVDLFAQEVTVQDVAPPVFPINQQDRHRFTVVKVEVLGDSFYRYWLKVDENHGDFMMANFFLPKTRRDGNIL